MTLQIYGYAGCTTVKKAVNWANENSQAHTYTHFNKVADLQDRLKVWVEIAGIEKVFNAKAQTFKKMDEAERQKITSSKEAMITAMVGDPRLIKRPVGTDGKSVLTGFDIKQWEDTFA